MKGLLKKDFYTYSQANNAKVFIPLFVFIVVWCWWQRTTTYASMMIGLVLMMQVMTTFMYDEKTTWQAFAMGLPVTRGTLALEKYIFLGINGCFCLAFTALCVLAQYLFFDRSAIAINEAITLGCFTTLSLAAAMELCIPLFFKYGVEKMRLVTTVAFMVPYGALLVPLLVYGERVLEGALAPRMMLVYLLALVPLGYVSYRAAKCVLESIEP